MVASALFLRRVLILEQNCASTSSGYENEPPPIILLRVTRHLGSPPPLVAPNTLLIYETTINKPTSPWAHIVLIMPSENACK